MSREHAPRKFAQFELKEEIDKVLPTDLWGIPLNKGPLTSALRSVVVTWAAQNSPLLGEKERQIENGRERAKQQYRELVQEEDLIFAAREFMEIRKRIFAVGQAHTDYGGVESRSVGSSTENRVVEWNVAQYNPNAHLGNIGSGSDFAKRQWILINRMRREAGLEIDKEGLERLRKYFNPLNDSFWSTSDINRSWDRRVICPTEILVNESEGIAIEFSSACHPTWGWSGSMHFIQRETPELVSLRQQVRKTKAKEALVEKALPENVVEKLCEDDGQMRLSPNIIMICKDSSIGFSSELTGRQFTPWLKKNGYKRLKDVDVAKQYGIDKDQLKHALFYIHEGKENASFVISISTHGSPNTGKYYLNINAYKRLGI